jgi:hypothetical protein
VSFAETIQAFDALLAPRGYRLEPTDTRVEFTQPMFAHTVFAIPDVHLCDGLGGDIFMANNQDKPRRLLAIMQSLLDYQHQHPLSSQAIQLGDWFDIWRICGENPRYMAYGAIQNAPLYQQILDLDAQLGLAHVIGNHDAAFLNSLPTRRAAQPNLFRLGFWLSRNVYTMHGHQTDLAPPNESSFDESSVALATAIGRFLPGVTSFEAYVDRQGVLPGIANWLLSLLLDGREDPGPQPRPIDPRPPPGLVRSGKFAQRENVDLLAKLVTKIAALPDSHGRSADVLIVGHSHSPCAAWTEVANKPLFIVDAGGWVYQQANLLIAADDTIAVMNVAPRV